jgi:hypothetical protein
LPLFLSARWSRLIKGMVHPAHVSAIPPRYHDTRKSRKNRRSDVMSDNVLKVILGALGGAVLALLPVAASLAGTLWAAWDR